jgi:transcriptional regulator with XRE-family HTH domain
MLKTKKLPPINQTNIGFGIREIRMDFRMSQKELAKKAKSDQPYLSQIENGKCRPSSNYVKSLAKALKVPIFYIWWKAIDKNSLSEEKREVFELLTPNIEEMFKEIFEFKTRN